MKKAAKLTLVTMLVFGIFTTVFGAGVALTGIGARAQALGGNYRALSNEWSGMYWNPAGIVFSNGLTAGFSNEFIKVGVGYTSAPSLAGQQFSATSTSEVENEPKTFIVPSGGICYSNGKFAAGLGVWAPFGLGAKWDILNTSTYNSAYPEFDYDDDLQIIDIHPTIAYKFSDKLSIGVGASIIMADIMIQKPNFTPNPYIYQQDLWNYLLTTPYADAVTSVLNGLGAMGVKNSPYDHLLTDTVLDGDGTGFGFNFGIMYKPTENLSIGISGQIYNDIPLEGTVTAKTYMATNLTAHQTVQNLKPIYDYLLSNKIIDADSYNALLNYYSGVAVDRPVPEKIKADLPLPATFGLGIAYTGINNLLLTADVSMTQWSSWDVIDIQDNATGESFSELVENWEDGIRFGIGAEYYLSKLTLRGGYYTEPRAGDETTMTPTIPDISRRHVGIVGFELPIGPMKLHASYEKIFVADNTAEKWELAADGKAYDNMAGDYNMGINIFMFGLDYSFGKK